MHGLPELCLRFVIRHWEFAYKRFVVCKSRVCMNTGKPLDRVLHRQPTGQVAIPVCKESSLKPRAQGWAEQTWSSAASSLVSLGRVAACFWQSL